MKVLNIKMKLLSDVVFGNGMSVPGGEDIAVLCDDKGFPYYKGGTFKGVFREELERYLGWAMEDEASASKLVSELLGDSGAMELGEDKLVFSDFQLSDYVKKAMLDEIGSEDKESVTAALTNVRAFTSISDDGTAKEGSLRSLRCVNKGLYFYSQIRCDEKYVDTVKDVLALIKWIGSMRNRGFGKVLVEIVE